MGSLNFNTQFEALQFLSDITQRRIVIAGKDVEFVRFGGLSSVKQKGYHIDLESFHSPPARKGIYAFVWPYIEYFLLSTPEFISHRMQWVKDESGKRIKTDDATKEQKERYMIKWQSRKDWDEFEDNMDKAWDEKDEEAREKAEEIRKNKTYLAEHMKPKKFKYKGELWHHLDVPNKAVLQRKGAWVKTSYQDYKKALSKELGKMQKHKEREGIGYSKDHLEVFIEKV